ncbi:hypothetical protein [Spirosoma sp. 48-14]|uniref:hypothetical protein n=1 Tax=Spirosoma sp. 48-14 TaxID=1895854 RepID=UPI000961A44C|nr:hypothetical protein [Spirosoma sp. 48-14]OJW75646.1 MAG: hypothetical protein BGO59_08725 [Spirosoma sp. 48-14]
MNEIVQILYSYFRFRAAVLRTASLKGISHKTFVNVTGLNIERKYKRRYNPESWKPSEIHRLCIEMNLPTLAAKKIDMVAPFIMNLPLLVKQKIFKSCSLDQRKLNSRLRNADNWQLNELERIAFVLEEFQRNSS